MAESRSTADWRAVNFAANMVRLRSRAGMSQADLVHKLRNASNPSLRWDDVHPTTISRIEKGERPVRFSEAFYIANALDSDPVVMTYVPQRLDILERIDKAVERLAKSYNEIGYSVWQLADARFVLRHEVDRLKAFAERQKDEQDKQRLLEKIDEVSNYLSLRIDAAVANGREASRDGRVQTRSDFDKIYGVTAHSWQPSFVDGGDIDAPDA